MGFKKTKEDFICVQCGKAVKGTGYTNHCPNCLWSKHVDNTPGDRAAACGGMMKPVRLEGSTPKYRIAQKCERCGIERYISVTDSDSPNALVKLSQRS